MAGVEILLGIEFRKITQVSEFNFTLSCSFCSQSLLFCPSGLLILSTTSKRFSVVYTCCLCKNHSLHILYYFEYAIHDEKHDSLAEYGKSVCDKHTSFSFWIRSISASNSSWGKNLTRGGTAGGKSTKLPTSSVSRFSMKVGIHAYWYIL